MIIKSKIIEADIEVGDIIYTSVSNLCMWGKDEDLQKGLITIKDNSLKEEIKVDECEVIDWLLGNI